MPAKQVIVRKTTRKRTRNKGSNKGKKCPTCGKPI